MANRWHGAGTAKLKEFHGSFPDKLTNVDGTLFFIDFHGPVGTQGYGLWRSDGTRAGTRIVKDINAGDDSLPCCLTDYDGMLLFAASDGVHGDELWRSNGTEAGTTMVKDINPGSGSSFPGGFTDFDGSLYFAADDGTHGDELWKATDTRPPGPRRLSTRTGRDPQGPDRALAHGSAR